MRRWAAANASAVNVDRETVKFLNHTFKTSRSDWPATWRNWLLEAQDRMGARQGAPPESFRERDARVQSARVAEFTGGLVSARPKAEVIDVTARTVDRTDLLEDGSDLRRGLAAAVGRA